MSSSELHLLFVINLFQGDLIGTIISYLSRVKGVLSPINMDQCPLSSPGAMNKYITRDVWRVILYLKWITEIIS